MAKVRKVFPVEGMHCAGCALHVEEALRGCAGVEAAGVNLTNGRAWAVFEEGTGCEERMRQAVENAGYELDISGRRDEGGVGEAVRGVAAFAGHRGGRSGAVRGPRVPCAGGEGVAAREYEYGHARVVEYARIARL